ncbi:hypothetical protein PHYPSEUDO_001349 [Phytophthora pseudosyringae]|uniref:Uncharacterized protein n=1 Tax=Phytophthora pseudosyringae TaxID=221518 RepID=A0A8T1WGC8_9STRA|nr:hypothetical protein PHYPSEUDO_001349 [Phytophthora pseudosyringae]
MGLAAGMLTGLPVARTTDPAARQLGRAALPMDLAAARLHTDMAVARLTMGLAAARFPTGLTAARTMDPMARQLSTPALLKILSLKYSDKLFTDLAAALLTVTMVDE